MLQLIWKNSGKTLEKLIHSISFPGRATEAQEVILLSSARYDQTFETLKDIKLYLQGDPKQLDLLLNVWPHYGDAFNPKREDMNGGLEVSFNGGVTYHRFGFCPLCQTRHGDPNDPATWLTIPNAAITPSDKEAPEGTLGAFSAARMLVRYVIPPSADQFGVFNVRIEPAFDAV